MNDKKTLKFQGADIAYYTKGIRQKGAILFLHPAFGDSNIFCKQVEYFSQDYFTIVVDMIGHGESIQNRPVVGMGDMPEILNEILTVESIDKVHIVGVSVGSIVAQGFAYYYPEKIQSVTVVGGYSVHKNNADIIKAQRKEIGKWLFLMIFSMKKLKEKIVESSGQSELCKSVMKKSANKFTRKSFVSMKGQDTFFISKEEIVDYPMLLVVGEHDLHLAIKHAKELIEKEPYAHFEIIKNAGHCANIDNPKAFNTILESFIHEHSCAALSDI